jgi:hypothetical protein
LQQWINILHEAYFVPGAIKSTAHMYSIDPEQRRQWEKKLSSLKIDSGDPMLTMLLCNSWAKKTFHNGKLAVM